MTREKLISREWHQKLSTYGHVTELLFRIRLSTRRKQTKNANSQQILAVFRVATDSENRLFKYYTEKDELKIWTELSLLEQEPTFKLKN